MVVRGVFRQYYKKFAFTVEINGIAFAGFQTCSEIRIQTAVIEHHEGGSLIPDKSPGRVTVPPVTLTRGGTNDLDLYLWVQEIIGEGGIVTEPGQKRSIDVVQRDRAGTELRRWTLVNAWPTEWKAGEWDNDADENTIEEVVLAYDYPVLGGDTAP